VCFAAFILIGCLEVQALRAAGRRLRLMGQRARSSVSDVAHEDWPHGRGGLRANPALAWFTFKDGRKLHRRFVKALDGRRATSDRKHSSADALTRR
jgi:hypothetical protein